MPPFHPFLRIFDSWDTEFKRSPAQVSSKPTQGSQKIIKRGEKSFKSNDEVVNIQEWPKAIVDMVNPSSWAVSVTEHRKESEVVRCSAEQPDGAKESIESQPSLVPPIEQIPNEVFSMIFREYVLQRCPLWTLMFVNHRWREVALTTPDLWSTVEVTNQEELYHRARRVYISRDAGTLKIALELSGATPLHARIRLKGGILSPIINVQQLLVNLFQPPTSNRIRQL
ncbi:hypothetical protein FRC17_002958, partial [Serendipita sp. 399]